MQKRRHHASAAIVFVSLVELKPTQTFRRVDVCQILKRSVPAAFAKVILIALSVLNRSARPDGVLINTAPIYEYHCVSSSIAVVDSEIFTSIPVNLNLHRVAICPAK